MRIRKNVIAGLCAISLATGLLLFWDSRLALRQSASHGAELANGSESLEALLSRSPEHLAYQDVALLNLLCAENLPGAEQMNREECLKLLDAWAERVHSETQRHFYRFRANPAEFDNSANYFRLLIMAVVLYEDFSVRYNPDLINSPGQHASDAFFADSRDIFLHGLCSDRRMGTCSSMPVLYAAIGRRLGYPLKLVTTKSHLFLRWEDQNERFNLEATGRGMNRYDDEHFKQWPYPVSDEEIRADGYLKSLTPPEELALFLSLRGHCLKQAGRHAEAIASYAAATHFAPSSRPYQMLFAEAASSQYAESITAVPWIPPDGAQSPSAQRGPDPNPLLQNR